MESLLGTSLDDPRTTATFSLIQSLLGGRGALQGLASGAQAYGGVMQQAKQQQAIDELRKLQLQQTQEALKQSQMQRAQHERQQAFLQSLQSPQQQAVSGALAGGMSGAFKPGYNAKTNPALDAFLGGGTQAAPDASAPQLPKVDPQQELLFKAVKEGLVPVNSYIESMRKERAKIKEFREVRAPDGSVKIVGLDEYGQPVQTGQTPFKDGDVQDFGGAKYVRDPVTNKLTLLGNKTMTPGEIASIALGRDRLNFDKSESNRAVTWQQDSEGNYFALPTKLGGNASPRAIPAIGPNGVPIQGKGAGMTEDQGKATGWLVQAANAFENMKKAGFDKEGKPTSAAYPGFNDALEKVPGMGWAANSFRSKDRQAFMQASSSLSEALLRAATGAGINQDEAAQKVRELTPLFGEDEAVTKQKMAAIPLYIESLKVRAGPGSKKAAAIGPGDPLGMFGNSGADPTDPWGLRSILQQKQP